MGDMVLLSWAPIDFVKSGPVAGKPEVDLMLGRRDLVMIRVRGIGDLTVGPRLVRPELALAQDRIVVFAVAWAFIERIKWAHVGRGFKTKE